MPNTVQDLINQKEPPITVNETDYVETAIKLMIQHDYSQLPVLDTAGKIAGLITSDSILRALNYTGESLQELTVLDARIKAEPRRQDEDLFEILNYLRESGAVLVLNEAGKLSGIITHYDITEFFRESVEDIMNAQEIEGYVRDYVRDAYKDAEGRLDEESLSAAIREITPSDKELHKRFRQALEHYQSFQDIPQSKLDNRHVEEAFTKHLILEQPIKPFDDLTLYEYSELFLKIYKPQYFAQRSLNPKAMRKLLEKARETRNDLAHLRQISRDQSKQLRYCKDWFAQHQPTAQATLRVSDSIQELAHLATPRDGRESNNASDPESKGSDESKGMNGISDVIPSTDITHTTLSEYLNGVDPELNRIQKSFPEIQRIIQDKLPVSAYQHRLWWANDPQNPLAQQWLEAGWSVSRVNTYDGEVTFERVKAGGKRYIEFYNGVLSKLRNVAEFEVDEVSPNGSIGIIVGDFRYKKAIIAMLRLEFPRHALFRMEVYIHTGDIAKNQKLYQGLQARKVQIEKQLNSRLEWLEENLTGTPSWTIALPFDGGITATDAELQDWLLARINDFYKVFAAELSTLAPEILE